MPDKGLRADAQFLVLAKIAYIQKSYDQDSSHGPTVVEMMVGTHIVYMFSRQSLFRVTQSGYSYGPAVGIEERPGGIWGMHGLVDANPVGTTACA